MASKHLKTHQSFQSNGGVLPQRDYKFKDWLKCESLGQNWCVAKNERIKAVAASYQRSVEGVVYLPRLLSHAFVMGMTDERKRLWAHHKCFGLETPRSGRGSAKNKEYEEMLAALRADTIAAPHHLVEVELSNNQHLTSILHLGQHLESLMLTQLVSMWTTFESMAGDLWEAAIDSAPAILAQKAQSLNQKFDSLCGIRKEYTATFINHADKINEILKDLSLHALINVRHIIAHKGGIADKKYQSAQKENPSRLPKLQLGTLFPVDGEIVARLVLPVRDVGTDLIHAVDNWLEYHGK